MNSLAAGVYESPLGLLEIEASDRGVVAVRFAAGRKGRRPAPASGEGARHVAACARQLDEYFRGARSSFSIPLDLRGSPFDLAVWKRLVHIPYGRTASYGEIAASIGRPGAARAVGGANHRNPVVVLVPCHRVVGSDGSLTGYGGGLWRKKRLLDHEKRQEGRKG